MEEDGSHVGLGAERLPPISSPGSTAKGGQFVPWEKEGLTQMRYQGAMTRLKNELLSTRNRAEHELKMRDTTISELRRYMGQQLELIESQKAQMRALNKALRDYQVCDSSQQRALAKTSGSADAQIRGLRNKIRDMELSHEHALSSAQEALDKVKRERNAMCLGLAALTQAALGGCDASSEDLASDLEAAMAEGGEPLPRTPAIWGALRYEMDDKGNLASFSKAPGTFNRPFDKDGARAFAALSAQVSRLHKQRALFRARSREAYERLAKLTGLLDNIDLDFTVVNALVDRMATEAEQVAAACGLLPLLKPDTAASASSGKVSERLGVLWQLLTSLAGELLAAHSELQHYKLAHGEGQEGGRKWREPHVDAVARRARALDEYRDQVQAAVGETAYAPYQDVLSILRAAAERTSASASYPVGGAASPAGRRGGRSRAHSPARTGGRSSVVPRALHSSGPAGASPLPLSPPSSMASPSSAPAAKTAPVAAATSPEPVAPQRQQQTQPMPAQPAPAASSAEQPPAHASHPAPAAAPPPAATSGVLKQPDASSPHPGLSSGSVSKGSRKEPATVAEPEAQATPPHREDSQPKEGPEKQASVGSASGAAAATATAVVAEAAQDHNTAGGPLQAEPPLPRAAEPDHSLPVPQHQESEPVDPQVAAEPSGGQGAHSTTAAEAGHHADTPAPAEQPSALSEAANTPEPPVSMSATVSTLCMVHEEQGGAGTPVPVEGDGKHKAAGAGEGAPGPDQGEPQPAAEEGLEGKETEEETPTQEAREAKQEEQQQQQQQQQQQEENGTGAKEKVDEGGYAELEAAEAAMFGGGGGASTGHKAGPLQDEQQAVTREAEPDVIQGGAGASADGGDEEDDEEEQAVSAELPPQQVEQQEQEQGKDRRGTGDDQSDSKQGVEATAGEADASAQETAGAHTEQGEGAEGEETGDGGSSMAADEAEFEPLE